MEAKILEEFQTVFREMTNKVIIKTDQKVSNMRIYFDSEHAILKVNPEKYLSMGDFERFTVLRREKSRLQTMEFVKWATDIKMNRRLIRCVRLMYNV